MRRRTPSHRLERTGRSAARSSGACSIGYEYKARTRPSSRYPVMAGLLPAISLRDAPVCLPKRDAPHKAGHDRCVYANLKLHARRLFKLGAALAEIEKGALREAEDAGEQRGRELLDAGIVFLDGVVEEPARGRELVLDVGQVTLQLLEIRIGLQVRIVLR